MTNTNTQATVIDYGTEWFWKQVERSKKTRFTAVGITITPGFASLLTEQNQGNRHLSDDHVARLADDMCNGRWVENGETIKFDRDGLLNDGQHRLYAAALNDVSFVTDIAFGVMRESRLTVDQGKKRMAKDILEIRYSNTVHNASSVATTLRVLMTLEARDAAGDARLGPRFTAIEVAARFGDFPGVEEAVVKARAIWRSVKRPGIGIVAALIYLFERHAPQHADEFWRKFETGLDLVTDDDPIYRLREKMNFLTQQRQRLPDYDSLALVIKAWNAFRAERPIKVLNFNAERDRFPVIS